MTPERKPHAVTGAASRRSKALKSGQLLSQGGRPRPTRWLNLLPDTLLRPPTPIIPTLIYRLEPDG